MATPRKVYAALVSEAIRVGWPEAFKDDLAKHDKARLNHVDAPPTFGWVLGRSHTYLLDSRMEGSSRRSYVAHVQSCREVDRTYFWDGSQLIETTLEDMAARMRATKGRARPTTRVGAY